MSRHLLHHHDNNAELTCVNLDGAVRIEALAEELVVETATGRAGCVLSRRPFSLRPQGG